MSEEAMCQGCWVPSRTPLTDSLCEDCQELHASPYWAAGRVHAFLYAPATTHHTEFCRICGKSRDNELHDGSMPVAALYQTHHATQGDAA